MKLNVLIAALQIRDGRSGEPNSSAQFRLGYPPAAPDARQTFSKSSVHQLSIGSIQGATRFPQVLCTIVDAVSSIIIISLVILYKICVITKYLLSRGGMCILKTQAVS